MFGWVARPINRLNLSPPYSRFVVGAGAMKSSGELRVATRRLCPQTACRCRTCRRHCRVLFRLRYVREIAARSAQIDDRKRRHDQRLRLTASETFTLGHVWGVCSKMDAPIGCDNSLAAWPERPGRVGAHRCLNVALSG